MVQIKIEKTDDEIIEKNNENGRSGVTPDSSHQSTPSKRNDNDRSDVTPSKSQQSTPSRSNDRLLNELKELRKKYNGVVYEMSMLKKASLTDGLRSCSQDENYAVNFEKVAALQQKEIEKLQIENDFTKKEMASLGFEKVELIEKAADFDKRSMELQNINAQLERSMKLLDEENSILKSNLESDKKAKEDQLALKDVERRKLIDINLNLQQQMDQTKSRKSEKFFYSTENFIEINIHYLHFFSSLRTIN